jgi:RNA polymerase sigma factor (sigma-70 family)
MIRGRCAGCARQPAAEAREDCAAEVVLALWKSRARLRALPEAGRAPYAAVCAGHVIARFRDRVLQYESRVLPLEDVSEAGRQALEPAAEPTPVECTPGDCLLDGVSRPELIRALQALTPREYELLDLTFFHGLSDREIGPRLNVPAAHVRVLRSRVLARLRKRLAAEAEPGGRPAR